MLQPLLVLQVLTLLLVANGAPVVAHWLLGDRYGAAIDGGREFWDRRALLGRSKTWRGLAASLGASALAATVIGLPLFIGLLMAAGAMGGDLLSSFVKRRMAIPPHGNAPLIDQLPEALLPLLLIMPIVGLSELSLLFTTAAFVLLAIMLVKLENRLGN